MIKSMFNSEHYKWGENCDGWHLLKSDGLSVIREIMPPHTSELLHWHQTAQQLFYLLSGTATFEIGLTRHTVVANECIYIPANHLHRISNEQHQDLEFLVISQPKAHGDRFEILDYKDEFSHHIKVLNYEWLEKYFFVENNDITVLSNPKEYIVDHGGHIYFVKWNGEMVGTAALLKTSDDIFELGKMAVSEKAQGNGIGNKLIEHCINEAKKFSISKLILYSNTKLQSAVHLYRKYGFTEIELEHGHYERANIKMELIL